MAQHQSSTFTPTRTMALPAPILLALAALAGLFAFTQLQRNAIPQADIVLPVGIRTPTPTPTPGQEFTIVSPDGKATLTVSEKDEAQTRNYSLVTSSSTLAAGQPVFTKTTDLAGKITVPFNTWSPDNRYLFLKETAGETSEYYVLQAVGTPFSQEASYLSIRGVFEKKYQQYTIADVTGWAAPNLLIINTKNAEGKQGPSFWFEVPSQAIIQLSTLFN